MSFYIPGTQTISNNNNLVGINTLNPNYTLDVNGNINFTNQLLKNGIPFVGPTGAGGALGIYGSFYDTTTQINTGGNTGYAMRYNSTLEANGITIVDQSKITFYGAGVFNIQFSAQFAKADSGTDYVDVWLRQNGTNVPNSNTRLRSTGNDDQFVASWNFMQTVNINDYLELMWLSADTDISILANTGTSIVPGIPSVILTVQQVMYTQLGPTGP